MFAREHLSSSIAVLLAHLRDKRTHVEQRADEGGHRVQQRERRPQLVGREQAPEDRLEDRTVSAYGAVHAHESYRAKQHSSTVVTLHSTLCAQKGVHERMQVRRLCG